MATASSPVSPIRAQVLKPSSPESQGIDPSCLERLYDRIKAHIDAGWYPGAAIAMARYGELVAAEAFGAARPATASTAAMPADNDTLWLLYSQTKPVTSCVIWMLIEQGKLRFHDTVAEYIPDFSRHGKEAVTIYDVLSHQAGFPDANVWPLSWEDHVRLLEEVCDFRLDWPPGSKVWYHSGSAHWVQAALIETVTGQDYRKVVRDMLLDPLGLHGLWIGVPDHLHDRLAGAYQRQDDGDHTTIPGRNTPAYWCAGIPGGGGYATATDLVTFYQMLLHHGALNGTRFLGPRTVQYVTRNHTDERIDERFGIPMHRGLGVHVRGTSRLIRGLGSTASPETYGHGGAGTSYSWADPNTGVSFTYISNSQLPEPLHSQRLDEIANLAHAAVIEW